MRRARQATTVFGTLTAAVLLGLVGAAVVLGCRGKDADDGAAEQSEPIDPDDPASVDRMELGTYYQRSDGTQVYVTERKEYREPPLGQEFADDKLSEKNPSFDAALVDSRPLDGWQVNASAAVIRLDCPAMRPDRDADLLQLRSSYASAIALAKEQGREFLPSANLLIGAAKPIDDGLYAAIDLACYRGELGLTISPPTLVRALFDRLPAGSPARPFLAAALELAGQKPSLAPGETAVQEQWLLAFRDDPVSSKPIGFYDWSPELTRVWQFYRFLQREFGDEERAAVQPIVEALAADAALLAQYRAVNGFYGRLTNPLIALPLDTLIGTSDSIAAAAQRLGSRRQRVAVFPPSTSSEVELFERVFPMGVPSGVNLMALLVARIRSGEVDLKPGANAGWYQYQAYALETMLLPERGREKDKLALSGSYKKRLVEAFAAQLIKHRETHVRQLGDVPKSDMPRFVAGSVKPRLRIEPTATFYLRTARAYAFLENYLASVAGKDRLAKMHGLQKGGQRAASLAAELAAVRNRFYGFYLLSCEDIGMKPDFLPEEPVDHPAAKSAALAWLEKMPADGDLAQDTRCAVPIARAMKDTRWWMTLGVRLAPLEASYAKPPKVRSKVADPWTEPEPYQLGTSKYVIAVDESAELRITAKRSFTRQEWRELCDRHATRQAILDALQGPPPAEGE